MQGFPHSLIIKEEKLAMWEPIVIAVACVLLGGVSVCALIWNLASGQVRTVDGLLLTSICLLMAVIFLGNFVWAVRSGYVQLPYLAARRKSKNPGHENQPSQDS